MKQHSELLLATGLLMAILTGCSNNDVKKDVPEVTGFETKVTVYPKVVRSYDIIPLEQTEDCILTGIRKVAEVDSSYVIFDNYNDLVVRYDAKGKILNRIAFKGRAASEYLRIDTFTIDNDGHILIFDGSQDKILVYEPDGKYVSSITFPKRTLGFVNAAACLADGKILINNCVYNRFNDIYRILSLGDKTVSVLSGFPMTSDNIAEPTGKATIGGSGRTLLLKPFSDTLYVVDSHNQIEPVMSVAHTKKNVDDQYYENHTTFSSAMTYFEMSQNNYFTGFVSVYETNHYLLMCTYNYIYFLVDKDTNSGQALRLSACTDFGGVPLLNVTAATSDAFIGYWRPGDMSDASSLELIENSSDESVQGFVSALKSLPEDGNPCLIVYALE